MSEHHRSGQLRKTFAIDALDAPAPTRLGQRKESWSQLRTQRGSIRLLNGREQANADRLKVMATHRVVMRYAIPLGPTTHRLRLDGRILAIAVVSDVEERHRWYELDVVEVKNPA